MNTSPIADWLLSELHAATSSGATNPARQPRYQQVYASLRRAITEQRLAAGMRLPSSRELARDLGVARNTIVSAFEQLAAEGYIHTQTGSGSYVTDLGRGKSVRPSDAILRKSALVIRRSTLSQRGQKLLADTAGTALEIQPFVPGKDDFSAFPVKLWQRLHNRHWREANAALFDYGAAGGHPPLRAAIARYVSLARSVHVRPEQVLITAGTQHSIQICASLLADVGDTVWVEDPGYWGARKTLAAADLRLHPVAIDSAGLCPNEHDRAHPPKLIYLTPSHHYPTGTVMSLKRRQALLDYAGSNGSWILEDDYDSEFRYSGRPLSSLQGLDTHECVIYLGTFSKTLYPGIKLAYMTVPTNQIDAFSSALYDLQRPGQMMMQATLADFIEQGHFASHMRRLRTLYGARRELLVKALRPLIGDIAQISRNASGLHLLISLPDSTNDVALAALAATADLIVRPLSRYYIGDAPRKGLLVGYAYVPTNEIARHARRLGELIRRGMRSYG
jgi:GntR family transcriptional regulator / MocR family aminotransferase